MQKNPKSYKSESKSLQRNPKAKLRMKMEELKEKPFIGRAEEVGN